MKKLLIANRGEIAVRIARAARDYGVGSVAVYAEADAGAPHAAMADEAYGLGPGRPADTYLDVGKLLAVARRAGADAVHPGYGFLSERPDFAEAVLAAGLTWVGPSPDAIRVLGDKLEARRLAASVGAPLVRGSDGPLASAAEAAAFVAEVGLPVAIKAASGGGGRGMRVARALEEVGELFDSAVREARAAFGRGDCYAEQYLERPRHVEAQVLADAHGAVVVLGTRDCTLQRRNQKLVEEAPAPFLTEPQRARIHDAARAICAAAGYTGAGTVEFLLAEAGTLSFLEVNTRLQVEHPVTEETTGLDIVVEQLRVADGLPLSVTATPEPRGHAFEFRVTAEDPGRGFLPTPGRITGFRPPAGPGVRLDSGVEAGSDVSGLYDPLMAKLIVSGATRAEALARARRALAEFSIAGVASTLPFHRAVLDHADFTGADGLRVHTAWAETAFPQLPPAPRVDPVEETMIRSFVEIDSRRHALGLPAGLFAAATPPVASGPPATPPDADGRVLAPIAGVLQRWLVADGAEVAPGDPVALIEAMKMETRVVAPKAGRIGLKLAEGVAVELDAELAMLT